MLKKSSSRGSVSALLVSNQAQIFIKNNLSEIIAMIISFVGVLVMVGWVLHIELLKSILPVWVSMKVSTAFSFILSGLMLYFIARFGKREHELALVFLPIISMIILMLMSSLLASTIIGIPIGVEEFFTKDVIKAIGSVTPGRPSVATMINFILIALAGITTSFFYNKYHRIIILLGAAIGSVGLTAILGYIFNQPLFYFSVAGKSSAMAVHTAILFVLWSIGAILSGKSK